MKNQVEGNMLQALSRALKEEVRFDEARITSVDWGTYPILTFSEAPEMDARTASALRRLPSSPRRQMPFTPERVRAALIQSG